MRVLSLPQTLFVEEVSLERKNLRLILTLIVADLQHHVASGSVHLL